MKIHSIPIKAMLLMMMSVFMLTSSLNAQKITEKICSVHFASDEHLLDAEDHRAINSFLELLPQYSHYEIEIYAHTDFDGSLEYNKKLSDKRARSVIDYLKRKDIPEELVKASTFGEDMPIASNLNETGKAQNRRVELRFKLYQFNAISEVLKTAQGNTVETFKLKPDGLTKIIGKKGTSVKVPVDGFQLPDGTPVSNKDVEFKLNEFLTQEDAILNKLSTQTKDGKTIQSGGMFEVQAYYQGQALELRPGKTLDVQLPGKPVASDMLVFTANKGSNGVTTWTSTGNSFFTQRSISEQTFKVDLKLDELQSYKVTYTVPEEYHFPTYDLNIPSLSELPSEPGKPERPILMTEQEYFSQWQLKLLPKAWRIKKLNQVNSAKVRGYESSVRRYERRMHRYLEAKKNYPEVYAKYEVDLAVFRNTVKTWKQDLERSMKQEKEFYDYMRWNRAINALIFKVQNDKTFRTSPLDFVDKVSNLNSGQNELKMARYRVHQQFMEMLVSTDPQFMLDIYARNGKPSIAKFCKYKYQSYYMGESMKAEMEKNGGENEYSLMMQTDTGFFNLLNQAFADAGGNSALLEQKRKANIQRFYEASIPKMGRYNCDRFSDVPPARLAKIEFNDVKNLNDESYLVVCYEDEKGKFTLYPWYDADQAYIKVPIGSRITSVYLKVFEGQTFMSKQVALSKRGGIKMDFDLQPVSLTQMKSVLRSL